MSEMDLLELIDKIVEKTDTVFLSTISIDNEIAETRALSNLRNKKNYPHLSTYFLSNKYNSLFITRKNTEKISQIKENNKVSVYYYSDDTLDSITFFGTISIVDNKELKNLVWNNNNMYSDEEQKNFLILEFKPLSYKYYDEKLKLIKEKI